MKKPRSRVASGDKLIDWFFNKVIQALNEDVEVRIRRKVLSDGDDLCGLLDDDEIYLSESRHKNKEEMAKTLLHEVLHFIIPDLKEDDVLFLEDEVWKRLSSGQKTLLTLYITHFSQK